MRSLSWSLLASLMVVTAAAAEQQRPFRFVSLAAEAAGGVDAHAWVRPGELLGWCGRRGEQVPATVTSARLHVAEQVMAGTIDVEWQSDQEPAAQVERIVHPGGPLVLAAPAFRQECSFRIVRLVTLPSGRDG